VENIKEKFDVIVVGAGPAGLFAVYELIKQNPKLKICLIEKGNRIKDRKKNEVMSGVGGAGTFSDGKLHFTPVLSHEKMLHLYSIQEYQKYLDYVDKIFTDFGVTAPYSPTKMDEVKKLVDECTRNGIMLFIRRARHVGSDNLPKIIKKFENHLIKNNVVLKTNTEVKDFIINNGICTGVKTNDGDIEGNYIIAAPGRINARWMQKLAEKYKLGFTYEKVEIGVRVEFHAAIMKRHFDIMYESIFLMHTPTFDDVVRTFCPCPNGLVAIEKYEDFVCVNGHSNSKRESENSNFALVTEVNLTEPVENTIKYGKSIAKLATTIGGGKPILQRLRDLRKGRRSTWQRINKSHIKPTLTDVTPGDISMALPSRVVTNILEGLDMLERVIPGINSDSTLLYAPEVKLRSSKIKTDKYLETNIKNLYVTGDGAGLSGNIVGAAATGIIAARGICNKINK